MLRKLSLLAVVALFGAALLVFAGCGSKDKSDSGSGSTGSSATTAPSGTTAPASTPTSTGNKQADAAIKQAVSACKTSVDAVPQLSASTKTDLEGLCDKAGSGDIKDVQQATSEVCTKIVKDTLPAAAQSQALSACKAAAGG